MPFKNTAILTAIYLAHIQLMVKKRIKEIAVLARIAMDKKITNPYKLSLTIQIYNHLTQFYLSRNNFALSKAFAKPELSFPPAVAKNGCPPPPP